MDSSTHARIHGEATPHHFVRRLENPVRRDQWP